MYLARKDVLGPAIAGWAAEAAMARPGVGVAAAEGGVLLDAAAAARSAMACGPHTARGATVSPPSLCPIGSCPSSKGVLPLQAGTLLTASSSPPPPHRRCPTPLPSPLLAPHQATSRSGLFSPPQGGRKRAEAAHLSGCLLLQPERHHLLCFLLDGAGVVHPVPQPRLRQRRLRGNRSRVSFRAAHEDPRVSSPRTLLRVYGFRSPHGHNSPLPASHFSHRPGAKRIHSKPNLQVEPKLLGLCGAGRALKHQLPLRWRNKLTVRHAYRQPRRAAPPHAMRRRAPRRRNSECKGAPRCPPSSPAPCACRFASAIAGKERERRRGMEGEESAFGIPVWPPPRPLAKKREGIWGKR